MSRSCCSPSPKVARPVACRYTAKIQQPPLRPRHVVCNLNMQRLFREGWLLRMAIIFTNASHQNLTVTGGTPGHLCYIGRLAAFDPRLEKHLDFTHLGDDLVYSRLWLPDGAPAEFTDIERLAIENDLAEMRRVRQLVNRERLPQIGIALISALPPDPEITLDEAKEIAWQIVSEARRGYRLAVYLVIHDPGLTSLGARNRHSHAFMLTREIGPDGLAPTKLRKGIALVRKGGGS